MQVAPEIIESIFETFAPRNNREPYEPDVKKTLLSCLFVSKGVRDVAGIRLFHSLEVKSSIQAHLVETLLDIVEPTSDSLGSMSIRSYIRRFAFAIVGPLNTPDQEETVTHSTRLTDDFTNLFRALSVTSGNYPSQISNFLIYTAPTEVSPFTPELEGAISNFIALPSLETLEVHGHFCTSADFLRDSFVQNLYITHPSFNWFAPIKDEMELHAVTSSQPDQVNRYPRLRSLKTDMDWPSRSVGSTRPPPLIFEKLEYLSIGISNEVAFRDAHEFIPKLCASLTTLSITYAFDGYQESLPTEWTIDFSRLTSLKRLDLAWNNAILSSYQDNIARGSRPLGMIHCILDGTHSPMPNLTTIHWSFRYARTSLPSHDLWKWLEADPRWEKVDELLSSEELYPSLESVKFGLHSIAVLFEDELDFQGKGPEKSQPFMTALFDLQLLESMAPSHGRKVFPRLAAQLRDGFDFEGHGTISVRSRDSVKTEIESMR